MDPISRYFAALDGAAVDGLFAAGFKAKVNGRLLQGQAARQAVLRPPGAGPLEPMGRLEKDGETSVTWRRGDRVAAARFTIQGDRICAMAVRW